MTTTGARPLPWRCTPVEAIRRWPRTLPLAALVSGADDPGARWSILGVPWRWEEIPHGLPRLDSIAALRAIADGAAAPAPRPDADADDDAPPFRGGWIGVLSYELGALGEPSALPRGGVDADFPLAGGWRCRAAAVHDHRRGAWWWCAAPDAGAPPALGAPAADDEAELGPIAPSRADECYERLVERTLQLIRAGDLYQANIAQRFEAPRRGSIRAMAAAALEASRARYGAVIEFPGDRAVVSMSPELFLERRGRAVRTRPIKGTRPGGADRRELMEDAKERAELVMIVDLMRNDLSRVCVPGSVRVEAARSIEGHCGVEHAVAEVTGVLRESTGTAELLLASFPPGSVTGAPKIRAMQVIESLEALPRGPYCGAVGWLGDDGDGALGVAIRTLCVRGPRVTGSVGCGIVADSDPDAEARERLVKLEPFRRTVQRLTPRGADAADAASRWPQGSARPRSTAPAGGS